MGTPYTEALAKAGISPEDIITTQQTMQKLRKVQNESPFTRIALVRDDMCEALITDVLVGLNVMAENVKEEAELAETEVKTCCHCGAKFETANLYGGQDYCSEFCEIEYQRELFDSSQDICIGKFETE